MPCVIYSEAFMVSVMTSNHPGLSIYFGLKSKVCVKKDITFKHGC